MMKFFVKWLDYDDSKNSWISWVKDLAALDTYLLNNPDIVVSLQANKVKVQSKPVNGSQDTFVLSNDTVPVVVSKDTVFNDKNHKTVPLRYSNTISVQDVSDDEEEIITSKSLITCKPIKDTSIFIGNDDDDDNFPDLVSDSDSDSDDDEEDFIQSKHVEMKPIDKMVSKLPSTSKKKRRIKKNRKLNIDDKFVPPIINYLPPKSCRGALEHDAYLEFMNGNKQAYASHMSSSRDIPRNFASIPHFNDASNWISCTKDELGSMYDNSVWDTPTVDIKSIPKNLILPSMLIYDKQYYPDGSFKKYKCRLVCRGDKWYDIYNMNTYASTVKSESVRMLLSIAAIEDWEMESIDVKTAFLHSPLKSDEIIYMRRPPGLTDEHMPEIVRLRKCIYGMPQASAYFHAHSDKVLRSFGCVPIPEDDCVYKLEINNETVFILKHVDDFGIMSKHQHLIEYVKYHLSKAYELSINQDMSFYLGLCIKRDRINRSMFLNQHGYTVNILDRYDIKLMDNYPTTPMAYYTHENNNIKNVFLDKDGIQEYQSRVGSLLYLAIMTRPDILFATSMASRKNKNPTTKDMSAVNRILYYIAGTQDKGLTFRSDEGVVLYATVDASYACHEDMKSHSGCTLHIGRTSGACQSLSKKQTITADSSTVAEFVATHTVAKEIMWSRDFLKSVGFPQSKPTILFEDNLSTISMIKNKTNGKRTKHVEVRYNLIRDQVENKIIAVEWCPTKNMTSDMLTKALAPAPFTHLRKNLLGMHVNLDYEDEICNFIYMHDMLASLAA